MTAKCVGCGLSWNISVYQQIPRTGYTCPNCFYRLRNGETLQEIQAKPKPGKYQGKRRA